MKVTPNAMQVAMDRQRMMLMRLRAVQEEMRMTVLAMRLMSPLESNTEAVRRMSRKLERIEDTVRALTETLGRITQLYEQCETRNTFRTGIVVLRSWQGHFTRLDPLAFRGIQLN